MIFTEQDLNIGTNAYDIINESVHIDGNRLISPNTISLIESSSIGGVIVRFSDVEALSEEYGINYIDSMLAIAEANNVDPSYLAVAVNEADIILNPDLVYELANVVTIPISENSMAYRFCEACLDGYMKTGDEGYIELLVEEEIDFMDLPADNTEEFNRIMSNPNTTINMDSLTNTETTKKTIQQDISNTHKGSIEQHNQIIDKINNSKSSDKEKSFISKIFHTIKSAAYKSADWIARKISALRHIYEDWQIKAYVARAKGDASFFQYIVSRILSVIDWALNKLENLLKASDKTRKEYNIKKWEGNNIARQHRGFDDFTSHFYFAKAGTSALKSSSKNESLKDFVQTISKDDQTLGKYIY